MESADREQIQRTFETWNRETLLEELAQRGDDFTPEARELLRTELLRRGVSETTIDHAREAYRASLAKRELPLDALKAVDTFGDRPSADAARDLLAQAGIAGEVLGSNRPIFGSGPLPITLKVAEHDLERARKLLKDLALPADAEVTQDL